MTTHRHSAKDVPADHRRGAPRSVPCMVVTSSDTRTEASDEGGRLVQRMLEAAGHEVVARLIVRDEIGPLRAAVRRRALRVGARAVVVTGGTGLGRRDVTVEALEPLLEKKLDGFGELFRTLSYRQIGSAAMLSRAFAGVLRGMVVFALPGSPAAVRLAMRRLVLPELGHLVHEVTRQAPTG